jgi:hypothetical protein
MFFSRHDIDIAITESYDPLGSFATDPSLGRSLGVDPGFGSSATGLVLQQWKDGHAKTLIEKHFIKIHPSFDKLITALRMAYEQDGVLDKEMTSHDDIFDAFRLSLRNIKLGK